jgi:hypothetical protein
VQYLLGNQGANGGWSYAGYEEGSTALAGLALLESGVKPTDPAIQRAAQLVRTRANSVSQTYSLALMIFFLDRLGDRRDAALITTLGTRLRNGQSSQGGWSYMCPLGQDSRNGALPLLGAVAGLGGDNSNTQFAILGLWVARRHGVDVKQALERTDKYFRDSQSRDGGWNYVSIPNVDPAANALNPVLGGSTGAMTCAGLLGLLVQIGNQASLRAGEAKDLKAPASNKASTAAPDPLKDPAVQAGLQRLQQFLMPQGSSGRTGLGTELYFLWSVERVGMAYGLKTIGPVDWYAAGADRIVASQQGDGSWSDYAQCVGTSLALLFLRRANVAADLTRLVGGESTLRSGSDAEELQNAASAARPSSKPATLPAAAVLADLSPQRLKSMLPAADAKQQTAILEELRDRKGSEATLALAEAIESLMEPHDAMARKLLAERLTRMTPATLVRYLEYDHPELRRAAAQAAETKQDRALIGPLIALLEERNVAVADAAHSALQRIAGQQFGAFAGQGTANRFVVIKKWKAWWVTQPAGPGK